MINVVNKPCLIEDILLFLRLAEFCCRYCYHYICTTKRLKIKNMAISIKSVPALTGKDAKRFVENMNKAIEERATVNFSKQVKSCASILSKAKI